MSYQVRRRTFNLLLTSTFDLLRSRSDQRPPTIFSNRSWAGSNDGAISSAAKWGSGRRQLLAQVPDAVLDDVVADGGVAPDGLDQFVLGEQTAWIGEERVQQIGVPDGQIDELAVAGQARICPSRTRQNDGPWSRHVRGKRPIMRLGGPTGRPMAPKTLQTNRVDANSVTSKSCAYPPPTIFSSSSCAGSNDGAISSDASASRFASAAWPAIR